MNTESYIKVAIGLGLAGGLLSLFFLIMSGVGDHPDSYRTYLLACAIILGFGVLALAVYHRNL